MVLVHDDHVVEAFPTDGPDDSFGVRVLRRRAGQARAMAR